MHLEDYDSEQGTKEEEDEEQQFEKQSYYDSLSLKDKLIWEADH